MKIDSRKRIFILLLILVYILTGFFREFLFLNINEQSRVAYYHSPDSHLAPSLQWLQSFSYSTLYYAKWPLTLLFTTFFAFLAARVVKTGFADQKLVRITWIAYLLTFCTGAVFYLIGAVSGSISFTYDIARFLAGLTETPALLIMLLASFMAMKKQEKQA